MSLPPDAKRLLWGLVDLYTPPAAPRPKPTVVLAVAEVKAFLEDPEGPLAQGEFETWQEAAGYLFSDALNFYDDAFDLLYNLRLVKGDEMAYKLTSLGQRVLANIERTTGEVRR